MESRRKSQLLFGLARYHQKRMGPTTPWYYAILSQNAYDNYSLVGNRLSHNDHDNYSLVATRPYHRTTRTTTPRYNFVAPGLVPRGV